jgi:hypothetical protein
MSTVIMHNVVSVDGFIADANDQVGPLFDQSPGAAVDPPRRDPSRDPRPERSPPLRRHWPAQLDLDRVRRAATQK